jgi:hypothetical protein
VLAGGPAALPHSPPNHLASVNRHREPSVCSVLAEAITCRIIST